ncbi:unnamed protein product [Peniophora sp. CBMAI 1063]|nr:unnamed protein product [Peniophora sp. CBMAI 1063]
MTGKSKWDENRQVARRAFRVSGKRRLAGSSRASPSRRVSREKSFDPCFFPPPSPLLSPPPRLRVPIQPVSAALVRPRLPGADALALIPRSAPRESSLAIACFSPRIAGQRFAPLPRPPLTMRPCLHSFPVRSSPIRTGLDLRLVAAVPGRRACIASFASGDTQAHRVAMPSRSLAAASCSRWRAAVRPPVTALQAVLRKRHCDALPRAGAAPRSLCAVRASACATRASERPCGRQWAALRAVLGVGYRTCN